MRLLRPAVLAATVAMVAAACSPAASALPTHRPTVPPTHTPTGESASPSATGSSEIGCDAGGHDGAYHIHALVTVKVDGLLYAPPANIGISQSCMSWVHTHDTDGIVHVEAPASVRPTLGDVLDLWQVSYPDDRLLGAARAAIAVGEVTVDDAAQDGNALDLPLADKMRIVLGS
jgi:hypothetical protein